MANGDGYQQNTSFYNPLRQFQQDSFGQPAHIDQNALVCHSFYYLTTWTNMLRVICRKVRQVSITAQIRLSLSRTTSDSLWIRYVYTAARYRATVNTYSKLYQVSCLQFNSLSGQAQSFTMGGGFYAQSHMENMNSGPASQTEHDFSTFSSYLGMNASTTNPAEQTNLHYDDISGSQQSAAGPSGLEIGYPTMGEVQSFPDNIDTSNFGFPGGPFQNFDTT